MPLIPDTGGSRMTYRQLLNRYLDKHTRLVEPNQGFDSLAETLWLAYSMGRNRSFTDLGTYAKKPGDHGVWPAKAFDLGRKGWRGRFGFGWLAARRLARLYWQHHEALNINYVIVGRQVISRSRPYWHPLTTGDTSHDWHIHVSGI